MTVSQTTATVRPMMMETGITGGQSEMYTYEPSVSMDHTLPTESFVQELSYAPSPDSLYMYDQDRQSESLMNICGTGTQDMSVLPGSFTPCEQQELKHQLEGSDVLASSLGPTLTGINVNMQEFCEMNWDNKDIEFLNMEDVFQDRTEANQGPTLTQLNSFVDDKRLLTTRSKNASSSAASTSECDWTALEDWAPGESSKPCNLSASTNVPRLSTMFSSSPSNWNHDTPHSMTPSASEDSYPVRPAHTFTTLAPVKEEPGINARDCAHTCSHVQSYQKPLRPIHAHESSLHKLLLRGRLPIKTEGPNVSPPVSPSKRTVTASAGKPHGHNLSGEQSVHSMEQKWEEIKQFLHASGDRSDPSSVRVKRERLDSGSSVITSMEELETRDYGSEESDGEEEGDCPSDQDSSDSDQSYVASPGVTKSKEKQYFWQYNVQSKGPKGKKICLSLDASNPHVLHNFEDPVFDPEYRVPGITHGGKARRGDGNNVYPNPKKLCQIGNELKKLNKRINDYGPLADMPSAVRAKSRKEKNKLASRACRLKKKAQHEANKVKLMGLEQEHSQLMTVLSMIKTEIVNRLKHTGEEKSGTLTAQLDEYIQTGLQSMIAGHTTEFVNGVIKLVNAGDPKGGLDL